MTFTYAITSFLSPRIGEPSRRLFDVIATCKETGYRFPLGVATSKEEAVRIRESHKARQTEARS